MLEYYQNKNRILNFGDKTISNTTGIEGIFNNFIPTRLKRTNSYTN